MKHAASLLIVCMACSLISACGDGSGNDRPRGRLYVQENGDSIEVRAPDGSVLVRGNQYGASLIIQENENDGVEAPSARESTADGIPADMPVLPGSTVAMSQVFMGGRNAIATITTTQPRDEVIAFYEEQIPAKGWNPGERYTLDDMVMLNGSRGNASLNVTLTARADTITINMARTESQAEQE